MSVLCPTRFFPSLIDVLSLIFAAVSMSLSQRGPSLSPINYAFSKRNKEKRGMFADLCSMVFQVETKAPSQGGVVVFFPSFSMMQEAVEFMRESPLWPDFHRRRGNVFQEPRQAAELDRVMGQFTFEVWLFHLSSANAVFVFVFV